LKSVFAVLLLSGLCFTALAHPQSSRRPALPAPVLTGHDQCQTALPIAATREGEGENEERDWTRHNYPDWAWMKQESLPCPGFPADRITLQAPSGATTVVVFDARNFYGKW
jgi:hypothetical protein